MAADKTTAYERWELPVVGDEHAAGDSREELPTAAEIESIQKQAYEEGHTSGYRDGHKEGYDKGLAEGEAEMRRQAECFGNLIRQLDTPLEELDEAVIEQTAQLAIAIARQIIRRELHTDPGQVVAVVREGLQALPIMARHIRVYLHPEDALLVREALSLQEEDTDSHQTWRIVEEPLMSRGGCRISSENSTIDATVETRLQRVIAGLLGGERSDDE